MISMSNAIFVLFASILVFSMTPGLAFFYGGLVSTKNVVNTMISIFSICGIGILLFISCGYGLCFSGNHFGIIENFHHLFLSGVNLMKPFGTTHIPLGVDIIFQLMFALVTPALFVGATFGRMKFSYLITFVMRLDPRCLLSTGSYHMVAIQSFSSTWLISLCRWNSRPYQFGDYGFSSLNLTWKTEPTVKGR